MDKRFWKYLSVFSAVLAALFALISLKQLISNVHVSDVHETMLMETTRNPDINIQDVENENDQFLSTRDIDFESFQKRNPDVYAWIEVPGTNIDYPILQHQTDNSYYLTHTIDHEKTVAASIYTENYNAKDFEDLHTVIYGHNMKNRTMFRTLHNFEDYDFFQQNRDVIIYLPEETRYYKVFAAYTYDNRHLLFSYDWSDSDKQQDYIEDIMSMNSYGANIDKDMDVTGEDKIITLSTCVNSGDSTKRYLVQAVLVSIVK